MITMKDFIRLQREGVYLFKFDTENLTLIYSRFDGMTQEEFINEFKVFLLGGSSREDEPVDDDDRCLCIPEDLVYEVVSDVPDWLNLTWYECVKIHTATAKREAINLSTLLCMIHNVNCAKKADMKKPSDFNGFEIARKANELKKLRREAGIDDSERLSEFLKQAEERE